MSQTLIEQVCDIARSGNDTALRGFLAENNIDLKQKNAKGLSVLELLVGMTPVIDEQAGMDHLKVVNTLLLNGAQPIGIDTFEERFHQADEHSNRNQIAAAFLMTGRDKMLISNFPLYKGHSLDTLRDETVALVDTYVKSRKNEAMTKLIDQVCKFALTGDDEELKKFLANNKNIDLKHRNSQGLSVFEFLLDKKLGIKGE